MPRYARGARTQKKRGATNSHTDARVYIRAHADYEHERAVRDFHCAQHVYVCMRACIYRRAASARTSKGGQANFGGVSRPFFFAARQISASTFCVVFLVRRIFSR